MSHYRRAKLATFSFYNLRNPNILTPSFNCCASGSDLSCLTGIVRRYYNAENQGWLDKSRNVVKCLWNSVVKLETVPYTIRTRRILFPTTIDKRVGDFFMEHVNEAVGVVKWLRFLPEAHPQCVRARSILLDILQALHKGVKKDSISKSQAGDVVATTEHLNGLNWKIYIVDQPRVNAIAVIGGQILLFKGILQLCTTDAELATIIGHEVAHIVARHWEERLMKKMCYPILRMKSLIELAFFTYIVHRPDIADRISQHLGELPLYPQQHETEADYIGLMLIASAGYDPLVAPKVYEKLSAVNEEYRARQRYPTHPSAEIRVQMLGQVMRVALEVYQEVEAGHSIQPRIEGGLSLIPRQRKQ